MMKKTLLLSAFFGLFSYAVATAQSFVSNNAATGDSSMASWSSGSSVKVYNRLRSTGSNPVTLRWHVTSFSMPNLWSLVGVCDNIQCHSPAVSTNSNWKVTNPYGTTFDPVLNDFHIEFDNVNNGANGTAVFRIQVQDNADTNSQKTLTFIATKGVQGVVNVTRSEDEVVLYPNPARGSVNVLYSGDAGVKNIALYNLIGKPVMVYRTQDPTSAKLELGSVPSGVYFIRLLDAQGRVLATRRFTHQ